MNGRARDASPASLGHSMNMPVLRYETPDPVAAIFSVMDDNEAMVAK
jgi:hypothetical protein